MHKIETILFGIALILFGIASILISGYNGWSLFEFTGVISPSAGLIVAVIGLFDKECSEDKTEPDKEEVNEE